MPNIINIIIAATVIAALFTSFLLPHITLSAGRAGSRKEFWRQYIQVFAWAFVGVILFAAVRRYLFS
ncbi:MAG: hypothetical protein HC768_19440 [Acaryochloris sp. CRU_2_0]|nr:hypothetical protein [Acaryochloris sp. CRU_2_0]